MPTPLEERDARICARYLNEKLSAERIALDEGLSLVRIRQILKAGGTVGKPRTDSAEGVDKTYSADHVRIGKKLSYHRMITMGLDRPAFAAKIQWSHVKLSYVEAGTHNLTLIDLQDVSRILKIRLPDLLENPEASESLPQEPAQGSDNKDEVK